jgi:hypothetical protein
MGQNLILTIGGLEKCYLMEKKNTPFKDLLHLSFLGMDLSRVGC